MRERIGTLSAYGSALLFPGAGHILQRRWIPRMIFALAFMSLFLQVIEAYATELHRAVRAGDALRVSSLLERPLNDEINTPTAGGVTPLHLAAALDHEGIAAMLIIRGADIQAMTFGGFTPLHWGASRDSAKTMALLIKAGADINATSASGVTPLHWAAGKNATNAVMLLIQSRADIGLTTDTGLTPLHWAVKYGSDESAMMLAYAIASDLLKKEAEQAQKEAHTRLALVPDEHEPPPPVRSPHPMAIDDVSLGTSLIVPIDRGESLSFLWINEAAIWFGKYEITNRQYRRFRPKHSSMFREGYSLDNDMQPAVYVSWDDARAFCKWLNKNFSDRIPRGTEFRLPTDGEWMTAARCGDDRRYPWGSKWPPSYGNFSDYSARKNLRDWKGIKRYDDGFIVSCPVPQSGVNEAGIYGLAGNVWEWCADWHSRSRKYKIRHGASWSLDTKGSLPITVRGFDRPETRDDTIGVRVVVGLRN